MKKNIYYSLLMSSIITVAAAEETRQVDKHEHGVGELNIGVESSAINLEFMIPGADITGFEYEAKSDSDIALVNAALSKFENFQNIFILPDSSNCDLVDAEIGINQEDDHNDHDEHDDHDEHEGHDEHAHHHGEFDIHFWLDPEIAKTIVNITANELSEIDPVNKSTYESNAQDAINDLDRLIDNTSAKINSDASYVVFHDAYQYFEQRFGIEVVGALTVNPEVLPGAKQLAEIREVIEHEKVNCLFSEPQFNPSIAETIAGDTGVKSAVLDPLGAELDPGKDLYFDLISDMAISFEDC